MDDLEFFDYLYQGWTKTTGAETTFWMPEEDGSFPGMFSIWEMDQDQKKHAIASFLAEDDAAWITALHGCFADLTRRLNQAVDEAERFEIEKDRVVSEMLSIADENNQLREELEGYRKRYG